MTRNQMLLFTGIFLFIIYIVPVVQTAWEFNVNKDHRIQMLDLLEDIFVTPGEKAAADHETLRELTGFTDSLAAALPKNDADTAWDSQAAERFLDEALVKTRLLRGSVLDFNRHVKGANNPYVADDTVRNYFRALTRLQSGLRALQAGVSDGAALSALSPLMDGVRTEAATAVQERNQDSYLGLTLSALRRIMVGASYLRPYEKEMENTSVFTVAVRPYYSLAQYSLFGYLGDKGVQGRGDWLFYRQDVDFLVRPYMTDKASVEVDANDAPVTDAIVDSIKAFQSTLKERGIDLLVIFMPAKPSIYPEMLAPEMTAAQAGAFSHSLRMMDDCRKAGIETVNIHAALAEERKNDEAAGDSLYMRTDTHFRTRAVRAMARAVADRVKQFPWYAAGSTEYVLDTLSVSRNGDILDMTKLNAVTIRQLRMTFAPETVKCHQVWQVRRDDKGVETGRSLYKDDYRASQVLVLGDSYSRIFQTDEPRSAGWISHLAFELSQPVASIVNDGGASTLVRETLARKVNVLKGKKVVVWEIVERDLRYGDKGWRNVALSEKADDAL